MKVRRGADGPIREFKSTDPLKKSSGGPLGHHTLDMPTDLATKGAARSGLKEEGEVEGRNSGGSTTGQSTTGQSTTGNQATCATQDTWLHINDDGEWHAWGYVTTRTTRKGWQ